MDVMCGWVWCEDVVSYHERGRLRPEGVRVIAHVHYEKVSHPSTLEPARLTSKCLPFPVLEKSRKSYTLPKKGMSKTSHKSGTIPELPLIVGVEHSRASDRVGL